MVCLSLTTQIVNIHIKVYSRGFHTGVYFAFIFDGYQRQYQPLKPFAENICGEGDTILTTCVIA